MALQQSPATWQCPVNAGALLEPFAPPLRQADAQHEIADRRGRHTPDRRPYAVEATVRGMAPEDRLAARRDLSLPIIEALRPWFEKQLSMISSGSTLATDIRYAAAHWEGLTRFLGDGRLELDTNPVENAIRPVALTRKNALFAGHEVGAKNWALLASIVATCKLNDVNPVAYFAATREAILNGHPQSRIEDLMPWHFRKTSSPDA